MGETFGEMNSSKRSRALRRNNRDEVMYALALMHGDDEPKCFKCKFKDIRALQIDHVYAGGNEHAREFRNNRPKYYKSMLDRLEDFQILCANCNSIKRVVNSEQTVCADIIGV